MKLNIALILILVLMVTNVVSSVVLIKERKDHADHPCGCDTCMETYWEAIRLAHPEFNMKPIDDY
jgi:hypothetical protein